MLLLTGVVYLSSSLYHNTYKYSTTNTYKYTTAPTIDAVFVIVVAVVVVACTRATEPLSSFMFAIILRECLPAHRHTDERTDGRTNCGGDGSDGGGSAHLFTQLCHVCVATWHPFGIMLAASVRVRARCATFCAFECVLLRMCTFVYGPPLHIRAPITLYCTHCYESNTITSSMFFFFFLLGYAN